MCFLGNYVPPRESSSYSGYLKPSASPRVLKHGRSEGVHSAVQSQNAVSAYVQVSRYFLSALMSSTTITVPEQIWMFCFSSNQVDLCMFPESALNVNNKQDAEEVHDLMSQSSVLPY